MRQLALAVPVAIALLAVGCTPKYPKCDSDKDCKKGEYCVGGQCQQCRDDKDCGEGQRCNKGRCEAAAGYCKTAEDCPEGKACVKGRCVPCKADGDCGPGGRCKGGRCLPSGTCKTDEDCPENHECQDGVCVAPPGDGGAAPCALEPVYFDFDEFVISTESSRKLQEAARCLKSAPTRSVRIEGHCDPRGTEEYNLALGDRRAESVKRYLVRLGVAGDRLRSVSKGKLEATGADAASWARDRKVVFVWE